MARKPKKLPTTDVCFALYAWLRFCLTTVVNFINVKRTIFLYERRILAAFSSYIYVEKRRSYKKFVRKMLIKLTTAVYFSSDATGRCYKDS
jgi:hypothetical protein